MIAAFKCPLFIHDESATFLVFFRILFYFSIDKVSVYYGMSESGIGYLRQLAQFEIFLSKAQRKLKMESSLPKNVYVQKRSPRNTIVMTMRMKMCPKNVVWFWKYVVCTFAPSSFTSIVDFNLKIDLLEEPCDEFGTSYRKCRWRFLSNFSCKKKGSREKKQIRH